MVAATHSVPGLGPRYLVWDPITLCMIVDFLVYVLYEQLQHTGCTTCTWNVYIARHVYVARNLEDN